jgi:hypothetical protein
MNIGIFIYFKECFCVHMVNVENQILVTDTSGRLFHTIRHSNGTWDGFVDVKVQAGNPGDDFTSVDSAWVA